MGRYTSGLTVAVFPCRCRLNLKGGVNVKHKPSAFASSRQKVALQDTVETAEDGAFFCSVLSEAAQFGVISRGVDGLGLCEPSSRTKQKRDACYGRHLNTVHF